MEQVSQPTFSMILSERREVFKKEFELQSFLYAGLISDGLPDSLCQWKKASFVRAYNRYDQAVTESINCSSRIIKTAKEARKNG